MLQHNRTLFESRFGDVYIPRNLEDGDEPYTFHRFSDEVKFIYGTCNDNTKNIMTFDSFLEMVINVIDWEFPCTVACNIERDLK